MSDDGYVPFQMTVPEEIRPRLQELSELLSSCREAYLDAFEDGLVAPSPGSPAEFDLALKLTGPGGDWPDGAVAMPRDLAVKLIRQSNCQYLWIGGSGRGFDGRRDGLLIF